MLVLRNTYRDNDDMQRSRPRIKLLLPALLILLAAVGLYGILPQIGSFSTSLHIVGQAAPTYVILAFGATCIAYICAATTYTLLSLKRLRFSDTLIVQLSGLLINRLLPAGIGGLGLNFAYLKAHKHTNVQATTVVTLNNGVGFIGHILLIAGMVLINPSVISSFELSRQQLFIGLIVLLAGVAAIYIVMTLKHAKVQLWRKRIIVQFQAALIHYSRRPGRLLLAVAVSCGLTLSNTLCLWLCGQALGLDISFFAVFMLFSLGVAAGTAVPTPGGLGAVEVAIVAGMIAQSVPSALALATVLLYRLLSFWLGLLIGAIASIWMGRRQLLRTVSN